MNNGSRATWSAFVMVSSLSFIACSSSSSSPSGNASDTGVGGQDAPGLSAKCAELATCCEKIQNASDKNGCEIVVTNAPNDDGVCQDALTQYGPECAGTGGDASVDAPASDAPASDSATPTDGNPPSDVAFDGAGCGSPGATAVDIPAACQTVAGACIHPAKPGQAEGCVEYAGAIYANSPSAAQAACENGTTNTWHAGQACKDVLDGIQAGCETDPSGVGACVTVWYANQCMTALGSSCNSQKDSLWVHP